MNSSKKSNLRKIWTFEKNKIIKFRKHVFELKNNCLEYSAGARYLKCVGKRPTSCLEIERICLFLQNTE